MVSKASEDLPDPDRPVNTISASRGRSRSTPRRLCSRAPFTIRRSATRFLSHDRLHAHAMCAHRQAGYGGAMTSPHIAVDDTYTGHQEPQTAARRTLPNASITKVSVGPMDNNAYLVTCNSTGETLLIDAANDAEL